ncbi:MAG: DUF507 family protein [Acidobacteria bacterium]|nr:DUF507 family protein [Acidobacteriota bacterium]
MRLSPEHIEVIAYRVVHDLDRDGLVSAADKADLETALNAVITDELSLEDQLNDEVREIMRAYDDQIRRADVEFHDMFKVIKAKLARERNIII